MKSITITNDKGIANSFTFKNVQLAESTTKIAAIRADVLTYADTKNREIARILGAIKTGKLYEEDGFKSVAEYADKVFGIKKPAAYALAAAGEVYNDDSASQTIKSMAPYKLAFVASVDRKKVEADLKAGKLKPDATQETLKEYAKENSGKKETKADPKVVNKYRAFVVGHGFLTVDSVSLEEVPGEEGQKHATKTIDEWDEHYKVIGMEVIKVPKTTNRNTPDSDKTIITRRLYANHNNAVLVEFYFPEVEKKQPPINWTMFDNLTAEQLQMVKAMLAEKGVQ